MQKRRTVSDYPPWYVLALKYSRYPFSIRICLQQTRERFPSVGEQNIIEVLLEHNTIRFFSGKAADINKSYQIFSNFALIPIKIDGKEYPTAEHYFQAMKFPSDPDYAEQIRLAPTPNAAKKLGKSRAHPLRPDWNDIRLDVMYRALRAKAESSEHFSKLLIESGDATLIEASPFDSFWGEGRKGANGKRNGKNMLGILLMELRRDIKWGI